jgi:hypothetical protein
MTSSGSARRNFDMRKLPPVTDIVKTIMLMSTLNTDAGDLTDGTSRFQLEKRLNMSDTRTASDLDAAFAEFSDWFSNDYKPAFIEAVKDSGDPTFISKYWGSPLWVGNDLGPITLAVTDEEVVQAFTAMTTRLHAAGYADSIVLDRRVVVYNKDGAAIDSLWSRSRADGSEIERVAVHFVVARRSDGIRVVAFETHSTDAESLDDVWPVVNG